MSVHLRKGMQRHASTTCAGVCTKIFIEIFKVIFDYRMNLSLTFYKDPTLCWRDFCKITLTPFNH